MESDITAVALTNFKGGIDHELGVVLLNLKFVTSPEQAASGAPHQEQWFAIPPEFVEPLIATLQRQLQALANQHGRPAH